MKRSILFALPLIAACVTTPPPLPEQPAAIRIQAIQGSGHRSPLVGQSVEGVTGVVTAVLASGRAPGFWMQDADRDGNAATSDAIFVLTTDAPVDVAIGDSVVVSGEVAEFGFDGTLTTTQIVKPSVYVVSRGNARPTPVRIGATGRAIPSQHVEDDAFATFDPSDDAIDFWESLEGMRVEIPDPLVTGATSSYGDMVVLSDAGGDSQVLGARGGVVLRDGDVNPERIFIEPRLVKNPPVANSGDWLAGAVTGVVDYNYGNFRVLNTEPLPLVVAESQPPEVTALRGDATHLTVATYNVLNLSAASDASRFEKLGKSIAINLGSPDVIGLEEMQDDSGPADDGVVSAGGTFGKLIDAIVAAGGPRYEFRQIDPRNNEDGGQPGGNIRVGVLFNAARVSLVDRNPGGAADATSVEGAGGGVQLTRTPGRIDPANPCFAGGGAGLLAEPTRKSLAAEMQFGGKKFFLLVNHLKSKRGDDATFGAKQPPAYNTEEQRTCQAEIVGAFAKSILDRDPNAALVVLGDMNEHEFRRPMKRLAEVSGMTNLIERVPVNERYTFSFEGNLQILDHIFVSPSLVQDMTPEIDIVHVNVDRADVNAASDHDPVVARLNM
jgi:predicted extracellular nuclease